MLSFSSWEAVWARGDLPARKGSEDGRKGKANEDTLAVLYFPDPSPFRCLPANPPPCPYVLFSRLFYLVLNIWLLPKMMCKKAGSWQDDLHEDKLREVVTIEH